MKTLSRLFGGAALVGAAMLSMTGAAKADVLLNFVGTTAGPVAGQTSFIYDINLPVNSQLRAGDFVTFYDVNGLTTGSINAARSRTSNFTITEQLLGNTPPTQAPPDDARFLNITYTYNGPTITGPTDQPAGSNPLAELFVNSTSGTVASNTFYSAQSFNVGTSNPAFNTTSVAGPGSVPEPGAVAMLIGMGATGAGFLIRRKRK